MEILKESEFGIQGNSKSSREIPENEIVVDDNFANNFTLIKSYDHGGGIWVPKGQEAGYEEFRDKRGEFIPVATVQTPADLKWNS